MSLQSDAWVDPSDARLVQTLWRRGTRAALIGAGIGVGISIVLGLGLGLLITLLAPDADESSGSDDLVLLAPSAIAPLAFGAMIGLTTSGLPVGRLLTATVGSAPDARRIRNHVLKWTPSGSPEDAARALRWAQIAAVYLPYQALSLALLYAGLLASQTAQLLNREPSQGLWWFSAALAALLVFAAVLFPLQMRSAKRARRYRDGHRPETVGRSGESDGPASAE